MSEWRRLQLTPTAVLLRRQTARSRVDLVVKVDGVTRMHRWCSPDREAEVTERMQRDLRALAGAGLDDVTIETQGQLI